MELAFRSPVSVVLSRWKSLTPPGRDTNPSQVSSQQMLVLIYLPRKDGEPSWRRRSLKYSNLGRAGIELRTLWSESRNLDNCATLARPSSICSFQLNTCFILTFLDWYCFQSILGDICKVIGYWTLNTKSYDTSCHKFPSSNLYLKILKSSLLIK